MSAYQIIVGDCIESMRAMEECSIDSIVCDPPYAIQFMGNTWDSPAKMVGQATGISGGFNRIPPGTHRPDVAKSDPVLFQQWCEAWATEALRVLKPGGHLLAFGATRMYHRLTCGIEDAGFEIRDCIAWMYGSGFPKSHNVSKKIDKAAGAIREVIGVHPDAAKRTSGTTTDSGWETPSRCNEITAPATPEAARWEGWGTALKPAHEPIVVARKPLIGTVAKNVLEHGTGALNIDGCRIGMTDSDEAKRAKTRAAWSDSLKDGRVGNPGQHTSLQAAVSGDSRVGTSLPDLPAGRWPSNMILDEAAAALLDAQSGVSSAKHERTALRGGSSWHGQEGLGSPDSRGTWPEDAGGGASRFFYVAKPSRAERRAGLTEAHGSHPTVKPITLMRHLVRLVTPPDGIVLDTFMGSGATGIAALTEGFSFIGCELSQEYADISEARIRWWMSLPPDEWESESTDKSASGPDHEQLGLM